MADYLDDDESEGDGGSLDLDSEEARDILDEALRRCNRCQSVLRDERKQCLEDRRFVSILGAQWEGPFEQQFENKPKLEVNKIQLAVTRIYNEYRANRITVNFIPKDGVDNPQLIDACAGLYRADEQDGGAEEAFDNSFNDGLGGGIGAWRLRTCYENDEDESEKQRVVFEPITDADSSVYFDLDAKKQDKSDAKFAFVVTPMSRQEYRDQHKDDPDQWTLSSFPKVIQESYNDWLTPDVVYICEYYRCEDKGEKFIWYKGVDGTMQKFNENELDAKKKDELKATGFKFSRSKIIKVKHIRKFVLSANKVLIDDGFIAGKNIPIVINYGKRWVIDNVERAAGHVRYAKDAQRLKNMQLSKLAEISSYSTIEKPIMTPQQVAGHSNMWERDNIENFPFLLVNALMGADGLTPVIVGPQAYTKSPPVPQAMAALLQLTEQDIADILGNQEAGEEIKANQSGVATELIQEKLDMQSYIYISNMEKAVKRSGEIWLSMAKDIYTEKGRKMKTRDEQGGYGSVTLQQPIVSDVTGLPTVGNDLSDANFDCVAEAGPSTASKRASIVRSLLGTLQFVQDPTTVAVIISMIMTNLEGEGIDDIRKYFRQRLLQMGVVTPTADEQKALQAQAQAQAQAPPDAQTTYLNAAAAEAKATAIAKMADTELTSAKIELTKAQAAAALKGMQSNEIDSVLAIIDRQIATQEANAATVQAHAGANADNAAAQATLAPPQPA